VSDLILSTATRFLMPLFLTFAVFLLLRGHNEPGGGFIGGLVAAAGFALYSLAYSPGRMMQLLRVGPRTLIGWGLLLAAVSGLPALAAGTPFLTALWAKLHIPGLVNLKVGTPLIFDVGVFLVVVGVVLTVVVALQEEEV
jgi:multicomponent Na+:H+ antiporter subunit B